eukprot:COSAG01_NODE_19940_length_980_cov_21.761635_2_plen_108_part_00
MQTRGALSSHCSVIASVRVRAQQFALTLRPPCVVRGVPWGSLNAREFLAKSQTVVNEVLRQQHEMDAGLDQSPTSLAAAEAAEEGELQVRANRQGQHRAHAGARVWP